MSVFCDTWSAAVLHGMVKSWSIAFHQEGPENCELAQNLHKSHLTQTPFTLTRTRGLPPLGIPPMKGAPPPFPSTPLTPLQTTMHPWLLTL